MSSCSSPPTAAAAATAAMVTAALRACDWFLDHLSPASSPLYLVLLAALLVSVMHVPLVDAVW